MRILFDLSATQALTGPFHGGGEYAKAVLHQLLLQRRDEVIIGFFDAKRACDPSVEAWLSEHGVDRYPIDHHRAIEGIIKQHRIDRVYSALPYEYYDIDFGEAEVIFTIHGLRAIELPTDRYEYRYDPSIMNAAKYVLKNVFRSAYVARQRRRFERLLHVTARGRKIVVDSQHTKYALVSTFPQIDSDEISVFYAPRKVTYSIDTPEGADLVLSSMQLESRQYFLLVNGGKWIKNAFRAIRALDSIYDDFPSVTKKVLVVGVRKPHLFRRMVRNGDRFVFSDFVSTVELEILYQNAFGLVYPTLNEGFGYPPLESMRYGTPVICSAVTSLTEVCGDAAMYVDPREPAEIRNRILMLLLDPNVWRDYAGRGLRRSEHMAEQQDKMLKELCGLILK